MLKKNREWEWSDACQAAFERLKVVVMEEPVLALHDLTRAFEVHTDASNIAMCCVLMPEGHLIAFESRKLNEAVLCS